MTAEFVREKKLKIGQHLPKLWAIKYRVVFYETRCNWSYKMTFHCGFNIIFNKSKAAILKL